MPTPILQGLSLHENLLWKKPKINHLRIFGSLCYAKFLPSIYMFASHFIACAMIGYSLTQKWYKLLNLQTKTFFVNRDVKFFEHVFPIKMISVDNDNLFRHKFFDV